MIYRIGRSRLLVFVALITAAEYATATQTVWCGFDAAFDRPSGVPGTDPAHRDALTSNVVLARGASQGLFNAVVEQAYSSSSPQGTEWATSLVDGNSGLLIAAANWPQLRFTDWTTAFGGSGSVGRKIVGRHAVVRLIGDAQTPDDDIYCDIRFTRWDDGRTGGSGGFAYVRGAAPGEPSADFDASGSVDDEDFAAWATSFGSTHLAALAHGDADGDCDVDGADFLAWQRETSDPTLAINSGAVSVPESRCALLAAELCCAASLRRRRKDRFNQSALS